jgi:integrase
MKKKKLRLPRPPQQPEPHVYIIRSDADGTAKIGAALDVGRRLRALQASSGAQLSVARVFEHGGRELEAKLHQQFGRDRLHGEWFRLSQEILAVIQNPNGFSSPCSRCGAASKYLSKADTGSERLCDSCYQIAQAGGSVPTARHLAVLTRLLLREIRRRRLRLGYEDMLRLFKALKAALGIKRTRLVRHMPKLLPESSLRAFYDAIQRGGNLQHEIMLKLLFYTAVRVSELTRIQVDDLDLEACKIFIESGKGAKDRYILFPETFRLTLRAHLMANPDNRYLFESRQRTKFTVRRVEQIVASYAAAADLPERVHPHLLRHQMISFLTRQGLADSQLQLITGHASKKSLEIYQHLSLADVQRDYQQASKELPV